MVTRDGVFIQNPFKKRKPTVCSIPPIFDFQKEVMDEIRLLSELSKEKGVEVGVPIFKNKEDGSLRFGDVLWGDKKSVTITGKYSKSKEKPYGTIHFHPSFTTNNKIFSEQDLKQFFDSNEKTLILGITNEINPNHIVTIKLEKLKSLKKNYKYIKTIRNLSSYNGLNQSFIIDNNFKLSKSRVRI